MKVTVCQLDNRSTQIEAQILALKEHIAVEKADFLLLPEMCFSDWMAADRNPDPDVWLSAVNTHNSQIDKLDQYGVSAAIATRPVINAAGDFRNQAYLWSRSGGVAGVHDKYYLPDEHQYWEATWYQRGEKRFEICETLEMKIGIQICTEMWFFEWARHFARQQIDLLCVPRATPHESVRKWLAGGQAAAVCAGAYCLSSNLWNPPGEIANCGGLGWIISPEGDVLAETTVEQPWASV
ncbi:MAG: carbon-nitrogen hydrolase family protein [Pseudomonadota bacterium]